MTTKLPLKIAEYINEYFPGKNFISFKITEERGMIYYDVYLHDDENRYSLKFSDKGNCVGQKTEPLYSDYQEQYF